MPTPTVAMMFFPSPSDTIKYPPRGVWSANTTGSIGSLQINSLLRGRINSLARMSAISTNPCKAIRSRCCNRASSVPSSIARSMSFRSISVSGSNVGQINRPTTLFVVLTSGNKGLTMPTAKLNGRLIITDKRTGTTTAKLFGSISLKKMIVNRVIAVNATALLRP